MLKRILVALPLLLSSVLFAQTAGAAAQQPLIVLIGPPLSGKTPPVTPSRGPTPTFRSKT
jgi:hypothetical protein